MVKLSLISPKGNQGVRYFPHQGYLGLTPLRFEGLVRTQIEQDGKPILAKDISVAVRCYELRQGRLGSVQTNALYEHSVTLWQKPDTQLWSEVGDSEYPFRFSIPSHITAPSAALYFQEYRIFWRLEAVLNHIPISAVGSRQIRHFELSLVRYDVPVSLSPPTPLSPSSSSCMALSRSKSRGPPLRYCILVPPNPIGPLDIVSVQLIVQPLDSSMSVRSASAFVERRIHFSGHPESLPGPYRFSSYFPPNHPNSSTHDQESSTHPGSNSSSSQDLHHSTSSSSVHSGDTSRLLLQRHEYSTDASVPLPSGGRGITHIFAHAESTGRFSSDSSGVWLHSLTFSWPDIKSNSRWAIGESVQTGLASVKFFLRVKLIVSSLASSAETVELEDKELTIVSTNDLQRQLALSRYNDWINTTSGRSKSKSPRCSKRDQHTAQLPSPPHSPRHAPIPDKPGTVPPLTNAPLPPAHGHDISTVSSPYPGGHSSPRRASRRPHTSAGPRDWPSTLHTRQDFQNQGDILTVPPRPETAQPIHFSKSPLTTRGLFRQRSVEPPRFGSSPTVSSSGHSSTENSQNHSHGSLLFERANLGDVQAWEQELARIESASRRSSADMLGFVSQRKKASVDSQPPTTSHLHAEG